MSGGVFQYRFVGPLRPNKPVEPTRVTVSVLSIKFWAGGSHLSRGSVLGRSVDFSLGFPPLNFCRCVDYDGEGYRGHSLATQDAYDHAGHQHHYHANPPCVASHRTTRCCQRALPVGFGIGCFRFHDYFLSVVCAPPVAELGSLSGS